MVGVEHDRWRALGPVEVAADGWSAALPDDLDLQAFAAQQIGDSLGARLHVCLVEGRERNAGDAGGASRSWHSVGRRSAIRALRMLSRAGPRLGSERHGSRRRAYPTPAGGLFLVRSGVWAKTGDTREAGRATYSGCVFGRKKNPENGAPSTVTYAERPGAKNHPTPSRREQEAANKRPLVPKDRKAAASTSREANRLTRAKQRAALLSGDESALPPRDKGLVKRFIRDTVDARWNVGEFMLPVMVVVLVLTFMPTLAPTIAPWTTLLVFALVYGLVVVGILDAFLMWQRTKKQIVAKFGDAPPRGSAMYAVMRAFQMRRSRLPRAQIKRGFKPE